MASRIENRFTITTDFPVRYAETDAMGVVHHANYLVYFEEGRSHFMREMGADYAEFEANGFQLPVTEVGIRYIAGLRYGQRVQVRTAVAESKSRQLTFAYEIAHPNETGLLATGFTRHVWTDKEGKVTRAPERWQRLYQYITERAE